MGKTYPKVVWEAYEVLRSHGLTIDLKYVEIALISAGVLPQPETMEESLLEVMRAGWVTAEVFISHLAKKGYKIVEIDE